MILGNINKLGVEVKALSSILQRAIQHLKDTDFTSIENGKHPIQGEEMFMVVFDYKTSSEKKAEQHKKYIDVQFMISGEEAIGVGYDNPENEVIQEYNPEKDAKLYGKIKDETYFNINSGQFAIFFPEDIHRPGCTHKEESSIRKCVLKIAVNLL